MLSFLKKNKNNNNKKTFKLKKNPWTTCIFIIKSKDLHLYWATSFLSHLYMRMNLNVRWSAIVNKLVMFQFLYHFPKVLVFLCTCFCHSSFCVVFFSLYQDFPITLSSSLFIFIIFPFLEPLHSKNKCWQYLERSLGFFLLY